MKYIYLILVASFFVSCQEKQPEFIQSSLLQPHFLIKNIPINDSILKSEIQNFILNNHLGSGSVYFYRYSANTKSFLVDKRPGGYFREYLSHYPEDEIANFIVAKCKEDTTKLVGRFHYYGLKGSSTGIREIDTLIYHCN